jgi:hypothetical protein
MLRADAVSARVGVQRRAGEPTEKGSVVGDGKPVTLRRNRGKTQARKCGKLLGRRVNAAQLPGTP